MNAIGSRFAAWLFDANVGESTAIKTGQDVPGDWTTPRIASRITKLCPGRIFNVAWSQGRLVVRRVA